MLSYLLIHMHIVNKVTKMVPSTKSLNLTSHIYHNEPAYYHSVKMTVKL